ncbi:MAG: hypothetical protein ABIK65_11940 [Candidatus Eisenbacteria bacterium]
MRGLLRPFFLGAVLCSLVAVPAFAVQGLIMDWAPDSYGWETDYNSVTHMSAAGSQLTVVGKIDVFYDPFLDLDPNTTEYTFIFKDLISLGSMDLGGIILTSYAGGLFEIWEDPSNNADFGENPPNATSPSTFTDGTLVMEGFLAGFELLGFVGPGGFSATYSADFEFTGPVGGELYGRVEGCYGTTGGGWTDNTALVPLGYDFVVDGHLTVDDCRPTSTESSNWGSIKGMFR